MKHFIPKIGGNNILKIKTINFAKVHTEKKVISCGSKAELKTRHNNAVMQESSVLESKLGKEDVRFQYRFIIMQLTVQY